MKFSFKIQQYQTDAVEAAAQIFRGQPYHTDVSYLRDLGTLSQAPRQMSLVPDLEISQQLELQELLDESGFKNEALQLTDKQILKNIQMLQAESNIHQSSQLVSPLGRCSLDIEMERPMSTSKPCLN